MSIEVDEVIHAPRRLAICAMLSGTSAVEFGALRDELDVSDSVVSKHLKVLVDAGYVTLESKTAESSRRPRTWASLTPAGSDALTTYVETLQQIIQTGVHSQTTGRPSPPHGRQGTSAPAVDETSRHP